MKKLTFILFLIIWQLINISESPGQGKGSLTNFGNKWGWTGTGEAFVPQLVMYGNPSNFYNNPAKIDSDIQTFIVGHGFNGFHVSVYCRWFDLDKEDCVSTVGSNPNIDPRTFDALEDLITKTYAAGGMVHIWMWGDGNNNPSVRLDWGGLNGSVEMNLLQEIANRLGPLPGWTMGYGFDVTEWSSETEATVWHDSLQSFFPQAHSLGARADGPNTGTNHSPFISWNQGFDYSSYEHHQPTYDVYTAALDALPGKPVMSEDRFRIRNPPNSKDYTPDETRQGLWNSTMAGGVANIWGNLTNGGSHANGTAPYPNAAQIKTYSLFFENRFQKDMTAFNNGNVYSLIRSTNTGYVFYQENTSSMQLDLSAMVGSQSAVAVDTKLLYSEIPLGTLNPTLQTWNAPYASDWAIAIGNFSGIPPIAVASATPLTGPAPLDVIFNSDNSLDPDGTIVSFWWDFGDGNSSPDSNPTHTYVTEGTFKAVLSVTDNEGHSTLDSVFITVDNTEPTIPTKLTATAVSADQIDLAWDESADNIGVAGYNLYRDGVYLVSTTSLNYSDTGLNASTQYCYTVSAFDAAGNESNVGSASCATTLNPVPTDDVAGSEISIKGRLSGSYVDTHASDSVYESIREVQSGGKKSSRQSLLEHKWTVNITGGNFVTFFVNAYKSPSSDGDDFIFAYSSDDASYTDMVTVTKTSDDGSYQTYPLPNTISNIIYIRVRDTDRTPGNRELDEIFVDHLFIRSEVSGNPDTTPPTVPNNVSASAVDASQIDIVWDPSSDNVGVTGYRVYRDGVFLLNVTTPNYSDTGLNASTQYCYTVSAVDAAGNESIQSQQACATTLESNTMHVENISIDYLATGPWNKYTPSVLIYDMTSQPVGNATVTGEWSGALSGTDSITTDSNGLAIFSQKKTKSANSVTFCVIDVTHNNFPWVPSENLETCVTAQQTSLSKQNASAQALIPVRYRLFPNYPNPFNPETEIRFQLPEASHVVVRIYNALGQEIRTLADGQYEAGFQSISWDGKDNKGSLVSSGIYLYQLKAGVFSQIKKMSLIR